MIYDRIAKAAKVGVPIVTLKTSDPSQACWQLGQALGDKRFLVVWDCVRGFYAPPQPRHTQAADAARDLPEAFSMAEAVTWATNATGLPQGGVLMIANAHRFLDDARSVQAVWNCRDVFKASLRMLVLQGTVRVPAELQADVIAFEEPLPNEAELRGVVSKLVTDAGVEVDEDALSRAAAASVGMSAFGAEQIAALNLSRDGGLNVTGVWDDKCKHINDTPGLAVVSDGKFSDIAGVENAKRFLGALCKGDKRPNCIVYVDEIEKAIGTSGDLSGVSQDQRGVLLQYMQDRKAAGCLFVGPPGTAKSRLAKCAGGESGLPTIQLDLGDTKGSLVGQSESQIRNALDVIDAVSGGQTLWLATCNGVETLPPELRRRFKFGTWFFDLPTHWERQQIWALYAPGVEIPTALLNLEWTGAEIESCCEIADRTGMSLQEAAGYIVPVSRSGAQQIEQLRAQADGRFLSAGDPGVYTRQGTGVSGAGRVID